MSGKLQIWWVSVAMVIAVAVAWGQDPGIVLGSPDDLVVQGTGGSELDPDVSLYGYVSLGTNPAAALMATNGVGSAFIQNQLEVGSNFFARGRVNIGPATSPDSLFSVATNAFQINDTGDVTRIRSIPYSWPTNQGNFNSFLWNDGSGALRWGLISNVMPMTISMHASPNFQWLNMPAALTEFGGGNFYCRTQVDLSQVSQFRLTAGVSTIGSANAQLRAQYSTDESTWFYLDGVTNPVVSIAATGTKVSPWFSLTNTAKADIYLRIVGTNGNGTADPRFGIITLQFK